MLASGAPATFRAVRNDTFPSRLANSMPESPERPRPPDSSSATPWVETREGGLFFVNALLVAPEVVVLFPLALGILLRALGVVRGPSEILDTIPRVAEHVIPWVGWLLVVPIWTTVKNLGIAERTGVRMALTTFLLLHLGFLVYTVLRWTGVGG